MAGEFDKRLNAKYPGADPIDARALRFVKSWHRYPVFHDALWYRGINLGEMAEYLLLPEVITALVEEEERRSP